MANFKKIFPPKYYKYMADLCRERAKLEQRQLGNTVFRSLLQQVKGENMGVKWTNEPPTIRKVDPDLRFRISFNIEGGLWNPKTGCYDMHPVYNHSYIAKEEEAQRTMQKWIEQKRGDLSCRCKQTSN